MKNTILLAFALAGFGVTAFPADQRIAFERRRREKFETPDQEWAFSVRERSASMKQLTVAIP